MMKPSAGQRILELVQRRPGMTEVEIAKALYGTSAVQQDVNSECRSLESLGLIERRGESGPVDPYRCHPTKKLQDITKLTS